VDVDWIGVVEFGWGKDRLVAGSNNTGIPLVVAVSSGLGYR